MLRSACFRWSLLGVVLLACAAPLEDEDSEASSGAVNEDDAEGPGCRYARDPGAVPDDRIEDATRLPGIDENVWELEGAAWAVQKSLTISQGDVDWYAIPMHDRWETPLKPEILFEPSARVKDVARLCAFTSRWVSCDHGVAADGPNGLRGCCAVESDADGIIRLELDVDTPLLDDSEILYVRVEPRADSCREYDLLYRGIRPW